LSLEQPIEIETPQSRVARWLEDYRAAPGVFDELLDRDGRPRPHWSQLFEALAGFGEEGLEQRFAAARRRIDDMGIAYRIASENKEQAWPLGRLPLLIPEVEWRRIETGVMQRAELLDRILQDVYGEARLVAEGALPAAAVTGSPDFVRPMCGVAPPGERWLRFYAADLGRGPDGDWWVLGDRAQAPSGAGYALENRLVLSRAFPSLYAEMKVERLAPFFRAFRASLSGAAARADPRICLMTPGPFSATYSEQVHLARYLGLTLVEGEDLAMAEGRLHVRTIAGLKRADVIWRRVDADWCDPLEMNAASRLGVAGMFEAIRNGSIVVANMPGAGLIESRALLGFLPALSQRLLGEPLALANVATWWCGQREARDEVLRTLDERAIAAAFGDQLPGFGGRQVALASELSPQRRDRLTAAIKERGLDYVGQEVVKLSTTPTWVDGRIAPRPFVLRVYAAATPQGWVVMSGGFCRVSDRLDARAVSMEAGAQSCDVWVLTGRPIEHSTLLPSQEDPAIIRVLGNLPSRAADNLFWMGRYLERAEATLRLVRSLSTRPTEQQAALHERQPIELLARMLIAWGAAPADPALPAARIARAATSDPDNYGSALAIVGAAKRAASIIRERLSQDVWQLLGRLEKRLAASSRRSFSEPEALEVVERSLHTLAALSGLIDENFNRVAGWSFLDLGRRIERAINACRFARQFAGDQATDETLDALLELLDSQITYRSRYLTGPALAPVRDMAMLDPYNPRSVGFQALRIDEHLAALPALRADGVMESTRRLSVKLRADIESEDARSLNEAEMLEVEQRLSALAERIAERYFNQAAKGPSKYKPWRLA